MSPMGAIAGGALAGAVGTVAMDLIWFARYRRGGGTSTFIDWEFARGLRDWEAAPAPAQVGKRLVEGFLQRELKPELAAPMTNVMHWGYGMFWGILYGIVAGTQPHPKARYGAVLGPVVWASAYAVLPPSGIYKPMWEYDAKTLARDLSAHIGYGMATAGTFRALASR
jgi:hypothetical protein